MKFDPEKYHRHSIRLSGYDYTLDGAYFVTIVTQDRSLQFGDVADGSMRPNDAGRMLRAVWDEIPAFYTGVQIDEFVVMPNHLHGIIVLASVGADPCVCPRSLPVVTSAPRSRSVEPAAIDAEGEAVVGDRSGTGDRGQTRGSAPTVTKGMSLAEVVQRFKTLTTKRYADGVTQLGWPAFRGRLWQRNYYEHVVRDDAEMERIRRYIGDNPSRWAEDEENPLKASL